MHLNSEFFRGECVAECDPVSLAEWLLSFRKFILSSALKVKQFKKKSPKAFYNTHEKTQSHIP